MWAEWPGGLYQEAYTTFHWPGVPKYQKNGRGCAGGSVSHILVAVEIAEKALIAQVLRLARSAKNPAVLIGIGDDCAVVRVSRGRRKEKENVAQQRPAHGLHFQVAAPQIACIGRAVGICATGADDYRAGLRATSQVRLVVRRSDRKINEPAQPVMREESAAFGHTPGSWRGGW